MDLFNALVVVETIDWSRALMVLDTITLDPATIVSRLGALLKYQDDIDRLEGSEVAGHPAGGKIKACSLDISR